MVSVEELYKNFGVLADAKDKAGEHAAEYMSFLEAVKGSAGEKRLASQFIARFFKYFPGLAPKAINALFDLCEDSDVNIRKQAIKDLPSLCKTSPEHVAKIAEALAQLLACEDSTELSNVQSSLYNLFSVNAKGTLEGLFSQVLSDHEEEDMVRDRSIKFLVLKLKTLPEELMDKDAEEYIMTQAKKVLEDVTKDEFIAVMDILKNLRMMVTVQGRQQLVDITIEQAELGEVLDVADTDSVDRLMQCVRTATPLFSKNVHSKAFVSYICDHVIPSLSSLASPEESTNIKLEMLKLLAEISEFCGEIEKVEERLEKVFKRLLEYMPLPPSEENDDLSSNEEPKLKFSFVECLMFTFHQLGRRHPQFLTDESNAERLKDFRLRLQYFARGVQVYIKQLRAALQGKTGEILKTEENKIKVVALKITSNINTLIKDLFHNPPSYKAAITLSWKPISRSTTGATNATNGNAGNKRITPITFDSDGAGGKKANKEGRQLYAPPSGKFSEKAGTYSVGARGRGRGSFRGYNRGRGRNFRRW